MAEREQQKREVDRAAHQHNRSKNPDEQADTALC
jgi:hypothetical protein